MLVRLRMPTAVLLAALSTLPLRAETRTLNGLVVDRAGDPVPDALLELACPPEKPGIRVQADRWGRILAPLPPGVVCRLTAPAFGDSGTTVRLDLPPDASGAITVHLDLARFDDAIEVGALAAGESLDSRSLRESFARDAGEALALLPGLAKIRKGGIANDIVMRGQKGDALAVRIDGHALHGACPNRMDPPAFHIDFAEIERIVVERGPFDATTGGLAGSIDILSRKPEPGVHADLFVTAGGSGYAAPSAAVSWASERWSLKGGLASRTGDPYEDGEGRAFTELLPLTTAAAYRSTARDQRAFEIVTGWAGLGWVPRAGARFELEATRQNSDTQLYPYLQMDATRDDATRARATYRSTLNGDPFTTLTASAGWSRVTHDMDDRLRVSSLPAPRSYSMRTVAESEDWNLRGALELANGWKLGLEGQRREWTATTAMAGMAYRDQASVPGVRQDAVALYAEGNRSVGRRIALAGGLRLERANAEADRDLANTDLYFAYHGTRATSASDTLLSGHLDLSFELDDRWEFAARLGSAERAPDPQERYFALRRMGTDWVGNPDLGAPRQTQLDLDLRFSGSKLRVDVTAWAARLDDSITVVDGARVAMVPGLMNTHARTYVHHDARMWGAEASLFAPLSESVGLDAQVSWLRGTRNLAPRAGIVDRDLPELTPLTGSLALRWEPGRWFLEAEAVAAAEQTHVDSGLQETPTPGWAIGNLRSGVRIGRFSWIGSVENLFDRAYREHLSYQRDPFRSGVAVPEPGRTLSLSLRYQL